MAEMDDAFKIGLIIILICFASALALWDPRSLLDGGSSPIKPKNVGDVLIGLNVSSLDWGVLSPGQSKSLEVLVNNTGQLDAVLSIKTQNWQPLEAEQFLKLTWDQEGSVIGPGKSVAASVSLKVSPWIQNIIDFNFEIMINAEEFLG
ncbi:MAG: hypothetical protein MUP17_09555 [candidate division Zixibacteria bacterium]|nr:hypothetical protein [candidate division Zixibacteria bacterium]